jgi:hypothetical protein
VPNIVGGKYIEERGVDLFNAVCKRNLKRILAKKKNGTYSTASSWLKIRNPHYTQSDGRHELFDTFKAKQKTLPPIPKKPPVRSRPLTERPKKAPVSDRATLLLDWKF